MGKINPLIVIGLPTYGNVSVKWAQAFRHIGGPLGSNAIEHIVEGKPIAEARNEIMATAINAKADFAFTVSDDVLCPGDAIIRMMQRMRDQPEIDVITGIYWTKHYPTQPYIWRGLQRGPYLDWKFGEFFEVDFAGCDCMMVRMSDRIKALGPEWFNTTWTWEPAETAPAMLATEDFYFNTKCRRAGIKLFADTAIQCLHEDRTSRQLFGLTTDMPQMGAPPPSLPEGKSHEDGLVYIADVGCGYESPYFGETDKIKLFRFDADEMTRPDYRCDVRHLPVPDQCMDVVHARHVLEHFGRGDLLAVLTEWTRILRIGGELRLNVPNLLSAIRWIEKMDAGEAAPNPYPWWQLYGGQSNRRDFHCNGFTLRRLKLILERLGVFEGIEVKEVNDGVNISATAVKARHPRPYSLVAGWDAIVDQEGINFEGLQRDKEPAVECATKAEYVAVARSISTKEAVAVGNEDLQEAGVAGA